MKELKITIGPDTAKIISQMVALELNEREIERMNDTITRPGPDESDRKEIRNGFQNISSTLGVILQEVIRNNIEQTPNEDLLKGEVEI